MADRYLNETFIAAHLGSAYVTAAQVTGVDLDLMIEGATSVVKSAIKNSGYPLPENDGTDLTELDELLKLAALGCLREMLAAVPESTIPLPENWSSSAFNPNQLIERLTSGQLPVPESEPSQIASVGGAIFTESDPDVTGSVPRRTTRTEMAGF